MANKVLGNATKFGLAAVAANFAVRLLLGGLWSHHLPSDTLSRPWTPSQVGMKGFRLDAPWKLDTLSLPLPASLAGKLRDPAVHYGHIEEAGGVMASRFPIARGVRADLDGAATGMVEQMRAVPGTRHIDSHQRETTLFGERAIEVTSRIDRDSGSPLRSVGIVTLAHGDLVQVSVMTFYDEPLADPLWNRVRGSIREN